jgi:2-phospho-L-lactate guanylyltransferase
VRVIALPVKSLIEAKSRLHPVLEPLERAALTLAMLEDVIDVCAAMVGWDVWVVSSDEAVLEVAIRRGVQPVLEDTPSSLGAAMLQVQEEAAGRGASALAALLPDTALVTRPALAGALHTLGPVVIAPATDEVGTNLLVRRPPGAIPARFGADSFRRHLQSAAELDLPVAVVDRPEVAFDLDEVDDILTVLRAGKPGRTREVLLDLDVPARLSARGA